MVVQGNDIGKDRSESASRRSHERRRGREMRDRLLRLFLRMMPILPGPELYDIVRTFARKEKDLDREIEDGMHALQQSGSLISDLEESLERD